MISRRKILLLFLSLTLLAFVGLGFFWGLQNNGPRKPDSIPLGDNSYTIEYAAHRIQQVMENKHLPSAAVILIDDQNTIWQETFGLVNIEALTAAEPDTVYKLWSLAKVFTAIETLHLVEDGLVELDAPITQYLPDFAVQSRYPESAPITIRSILTHRSGLPRNGCHWVEFSNRVLGDLASSLSDCHQAYPVGYRYKYSNIGFDLLGAIIEERRGGLFPSIMHETLFQPLGMNHSAFIRSQLPSDLEIASGYEYYQGEYYPLEQNDITSVPSGNLFSTLEDMGKFLKFIFRDGEVNGEQIIKPETLESMFQTQPSNPNDPQPMGLGWKTARTLGGEKLVWHDGGPTEGIGGVIAFIPDRNLGIVLIANGTTFDSALGLPLAIDILEIMLEIKLGISTQEVVPQNPITLDPADLEPYVGKYIAFGEVMDVKLKGDQLTGKISGLSISLDPLSATTFKPRHWLADLGLLSLLQIPIDLDELEIGFNIEDDVMVISMGYFLYEICPRYPDMSEVPNLWDDLSGDYDLLARLPSGEVGSDIFGSAAIWVEDGVLQMGGVAGPLLPISGTEIIILSGPFAGESMIYHPGTGTITHQKIIYKPQHNVD